MNFGRTMVIVTWLNVNAIIYNIIIFIYYTFWKVLDLPTLPNYKFL